MSRNTTTIIMSFPHPAAHESCCFTRKVASLRRRTGTATVGFKFQQRHLFLRLLLVLYVLTTGYQKVLIRNYLHVKERNNT